MKINSRNNMENQKLTEEEKKICEQAEEIISSVIVSMFLQKNNANPTIKLNAIYNIGVKTRELTELLGVSEQDVINLLRKRYQNAEMALKPYMIKQHEPMRNKPNNQPQKRATNTIGDFAQLQKIKFEND